MNNTQNQNYIIVQVNNQEVLLEHDYNPKNDSGNYMNIKQRAFFKNMLLQWNQSILESLENIPEEIGSFHLDIHSVDEADMANIEAEIISNLRTKDRQTKLLYRIAETIRKIDNNAYGYCEETNEPTGIARLLLRPITKFCVEVQREKEDQELDLENTAYNFDQELELETEE